jgi:uncharacterized protein (TIGR02145 family)
MSILKNEIMNRLILILVVFIVQLPGVHAQNALPVPKKLYKTWINLLDTKQTQKGVFYETRDSSIILSDSYVKTDYLDGRYNLIKFDVSNISNISLRNQNAIGTGVLIGALSGVGLGALIGLTSTNTADDPNASAGLTAASTIVSSVFMGSIGAIIGVAFGTIKTHVHVHGSQQQFEKHRDRLDSRSVTYDPAMEGIRQPSFKRLRDTVVDADGNVYHTVALGAMVFMAENLKVKHFRNGKEIPGVKDSADWRTATAAAWCNYMNDQVVAGQYGKLYNGFAISDTSGICPEGWHIPSFDEWTSLIMCLGGHDNAGGYMKEEGTAHWSNPNKTMLAESTFALPGGNRNRNGIFSPRGQSCQWWASKVPESDDFQGISLTNETTAATVIAPDKNAGLSVRCMRNE